MNRKKRIVCWLLTIVIISGLFAGCAPQEQAIETIYSIDSELNELIEWDDAFETTITLSGYKWAEQITKQDIVLTQAFTDMAVEDVTRISDSQLKISAKGLLQSAFSAGTISFEPNTVLDPHEEDEQKGIEASNADGVAIEDISPVVYSVDITILHPDAEVAIDNTDGSDAVLTVSLTDCAFTDAANEGNFSFMNAQSAPKVISAVREDDQTMKLTLSPDAAPDIDTLFAQICDATLCIASDAVSTGIELQTHVGSYDAQFEVSVDYIENKADGFLVSLLLSCSNGNFSDLAQSQIALTGNLGSVSSVEMLDDDTAELKVIVKKANVTLDTLTLDGHIQINGQWGENLWGSPCKDANMSVHYAAQESSKELLAIETDLMFDLLKSGITALATSIGSAAGNRMMEAINSDLFADETMRQLTDMNKYLRSMDAKWTNILSSVDTHLAIMEDKIGSNNCSRVLDEYDTLANTLQATVMHLENKKESVDAAEKDTPEYEAAKQEYIKAVDKETCKVYTNAYVLGQKLLKGSAGLSSGVVGTYDEMLSLLYNFDVQTYDLKEDFRVMTLALYLKAYDQAVLYYQLTDPNNSLLKQLESQLVSISRLLDGMKVVRRTDDNVFCYAAGKTLKRYIRGVMGAGAYVSTQITGTNAEKMISRAQYRNTTLGADIDQAGFYKSEGTIDSFDVLIVDCVCSKQYTSTKREWWTTMTKVNIRTHGIEKNVKTYYQRQECPWYDFMWTQKECWGVYDFQGFMLQNG